MTLRTSLLATADLVRSLAATETLSGDEGLDVWICPVTILTRTWPSGEPGRGTPNDVLLVVSPTPEVREVNAREVAGSGGLYRPMDVRIGQITPAYDGEGDAPGGGYTPEQLAPRPTMRGVEIIYRLGGPLVGEYHRVEARFSDPFEYALIVRRKNVTP